jgi:LPS-assembly lipoprotein
MNALKRLLLIGAALTASTALGGCGFTPLYASPDVTSKMAQIEVLRPDGRAGFLLGQSLDDELGHNAAKPAIYRLAVQLKETRIPRGITVNNVATRYELDVVATYALTDIKTHKTITRGAISVNATYNDTTQPYAGIAAQLDGERRASEAAAQRIRLELASWFASPGPALPDAYAPEDKPLISSTFTEGYGADTVQSPRERAAAGGGSNGPGPADIPDPYGVNYGTGAAGQP